MFSKRSRTQWLPALSKDRRSVGRSVRRNPRSREKRLRETEQRALPARRARGSSRLADLPSRRDRLAPVSSSHWGPPAV